MLLSGFQDIRGFFEPVRVSIFKLARIRLYNWEVSSFFSRWGELLELADNSELLLAQGYLGPLAMQGRRVSRLRRFPKLGSVLVVVEEVFVRRISFFLIVLSLNEAWVLVHASHARWILLHKFASYQPISWGSRLLLEEELIRVLMKLFLKVLLLWSLSIWVLLIARWPPYLFIEANFWIIMVAHILNRGILRNGLIAIVFIVPFIFLHSYDRSWWAYSKLTTYSRWSSILLIRALKRKIRLMSDLSLYSFLLSGWNSLSLFLVLQSILSILGTWANLLSRSGLLKVVPEWAILVLFEARSLLALPLGVNGFSTPLFWACLQILLALVHLVLGYRSEWGAGFSITRSTLIIASRAVSLAPFRLSPLFLRAYSIESSFLGICPIADSIL